MSAVASEMQAPKKRVLIGWNSSGGLEGRLSGMKTRSRGQDSVTVVGFESGPLPKSHAISVNALVNATF